MNRWLALALSIGALFLASWMILPAPTYFLLTFSVGAPEVAPWIAAGSAVALVIAIRDVIRSKIAGAAALMAGAAMIISIMTLQPFRNTVRRFDDATAAMTVAPEPAARTSRFSMFDFIRGIDIGTARITRHVPAIQHKGTALSVDVYQPPWPGRFPILVQIYGGAWQRGDPAANADFATWLASHGWVVFAIDYRHAPAFRWAAIQADVDSSLAWIRRHAAEYEGDTSRVVLMGRSAGAHLAKMAAYREPALRVRGVVSYYGPANLMDAYRNPPRPDPLNIRSVEEKFIGGTLDDLPLDYARASPVTYVTRPLPPTLLVYGRRDNITEARYGRMLRDQLASSGTRVAYLEIPWAGHAFDAVFHGVSSQLALYYVERFLTWAVRQDGATLHVGGGPL